MRIVMIGAGSVVFSRRLISDLLLLPGIDDAELVLNDIDPERLSTAARLAGRLVEGAPARPRISTAPDRRTAIAGADVVINTIEVGGEAAARVDFDVPGRYGLRYAINDTIGVGGVMRGLRMIGPVLDIVADIEELAPDAWLLNHSNPMAMVVRAVAARTEVRTIGLCHAVGNTVADVGRYLGIPAGEIDFVSGGVNHLAFLLAIEHRGRDLYPDLRAFARSDELPPDDLVRLDLLRRLGHFPSESSEHHADYNPWYTPKVGMVERFGVPIGEYLDRIEAGKAEHAQLVATLDAGEPIALERSGEETAAIVGVLRGGDPVRIVANTMNGPDLVPDLPLDACIEVPARVDAGGLEPEHVALPPQCVAYMHPAVDTQSLTVLAALEHDRDAVYQAMMTDPIVAASLDLDSVWRMTDELIAAEAPWLPEWLGGAVKARV